MHEKYILHTRKIYVTCVKNICYMRNGDAQEHALPVLFKNSHNI